MTDSQRTLGVGIVGAGAVGSLLGIALSAAGASVVLVGRRPLSRDARGMRAHLVGGRELAPTSSLRYTDGIEALRSARVCVVSVKSNDTREAARSLATVVSESTTVVSFQNGLRNVERLREHVSCEVVPGVVGFNMHLDSTGHVHQDTRGHLFVGTSSRAARHVAELARLFRRSGLHLEVRRDIDNVMAGKLLMNLSNGVCAATGLGIVDLMRDRDARWCFAQCIREGVAVMRRHGYSPAAVRLLRPAVVARILDFPDALVTTVARWLLSTRNEARLSTLQDLDRGRRTEIDDIQGEIVARAQQEGQAVPANQVVLEVVHALESDLAPGVRPSFLSSAELRARITERL